MKKENTPTHDKHEHAANMSWQRILDFGTEVVKPKMRDQQRRTHAPIFVVLP